MPPQIRLHPTASRFNLSLNLDLLAAHPGFVGLSNEWEGGFDISRQAFRQGIDPRDQA
jgi:hypothetical protein